MINSIFGMPQCTHLTTEYLYVLLTKQHLYEADKYVIHLQTYHLSLDNLPHVLDDR